MVVKLEERKVVVAAPRALRSYAWVNPNPNSTGATVARVVLGTILLAHGLQKLGLWGGHGWSGTLASFESQLGIPTWLGAIAILTEAVGGGLLVLGLAARFVAVAVIVEMVVAATKVHVPHGFFLNMNLTPGVGHGFEFNLALVGLAAVVLFEGAGRGALDTFLVKRASAATPTVQ